MQIQSAEPSQLNSIPRRLGTKSPVNPSNVQRRDRQLAWSGTAIPALTGMVIYRVIASQRRSPDRALRDRDEFC